MQGYITATKSINIGGSNYFQLIGITSVLPVSTLNCKKSIAMKITHLLCRRDQHVFTIIWDMVVPDVDFHTADASCSCETYWSNRNCIYDNYGGSNGLSTLDTDLTSFGLGAETITYVGGAGAAVSRIPIGSFIFGLITTVGEFTIWKKVFFGNITFL